MPLLFGCGVDPIDAAQDTGLEPAPIASPAGVAGVVVDADGAPLAGALVTTDPRGYEALAGSDGRFEIQWLPPGDYRLVAAAEGWRAASSDAVEVIEGQTAEVELRLEQPAETWSRIEVRVEGADGQPLAGAVVDAGGAQAETDEDGLAALEGLTGVISLSISDPSGVHRGRSLGSWDVGEAGGLQWWVGLSGTPPDNSDYIGSETCAFCHEDVPEHGDTLHADALTDDPGATLDAWFDDGASVMLGNGATARLGRSGGAPAVTLTDSGGQSRTYEAALFLASPSRATVPMARDDGRYWPLPVVFRAEDPARPGFVDAEAALLPFQLDRWFDGGGVLVDLDPLRSAEHECLACHVTGFELEWDSDGAITLDARTGGQWEEDGVGCERCHGPGEEHLQAPDAEKAFLITHPGRLDPDRADEVCGQCHAQVTSPDGLPYPWTEELGLFAPGAALLDYGESAARHWTSGAAAAPRMQLDEQRLSAHGDAGPASLRCTDCHGAHGTGEAHDLLLPADDNELCLSCHEGYTFGGDRDAVRLHTGHGYYNPGGRTESGRCTGCHMPPIATDYAFSERSGAGTLASHLFAMPAPADTLEVFGGASSLDVGEFPAHGCSDCHAYNAEQWADLGATFTGPDGDPTLSTTHQAFDEAAGEILP